MKYWKFHKNDNILKIYFIFPKIVPWQKNINFVFKQTPFKTSRAQWAVVMKVKKKRSLIQFPKTHFCLGTENNG